jgi:predicted nucleic acid-binding protein
VIVVDTNVISYFLIRGERTEKIERLYENDSDWIAPRLWIDEFLNVLATYERSDKLPSHEIAPILSDALELMDGCTFEIPPDRILSVARRTKCSAYDSQYIALAEDRGLKFYTCDQRVLRACPDIAREP